MQLVVSELKTLSEYTKLNIVKKDPKIVHIDFIVLKERCPLSYRKVWPIPLEKLSADEPL